MRRTCLAAATAFLVAVAHAQSAPLSVLVLDFGARGDVGEIDGAEVADAMATELASLRQVDVVERGTTLRDLPVRALRLSDSARKAAILKACGEKGIDVVVNGTVIKDQGRFHLSVNAISTANGLAFEDSVSARRGAGISSLVGSLSAKLAKRIQNARGALEDRSFRLPSVEREVAE